MRPRVAVVGLLVAVLSCDKPTAPARGDLSVFVSGLPSAVSWRVILAAPGSAPINVTSNGTLEDLPAGDYSLHTEEVSLAPDTIATPADTTVRVVAGQLTRIERRFDFRTGGLRLQVVNAPPVDSVRVTLLSPRGEERVVKLPAVLRGLAAGTWTIIPTLQRAANGDLYAATAPGTVEVKASATETTVPFSYSIASGSIEFRFTGLPAGEEPSGFYYGADRVQHFVTSDTVVRGVPAGGYWMGIYDVRGRAFAYLGNRQEYQYVSPGPAPVLVLGAYTLSSGAFRLTVAGSPAGGTPVIRLFNRARNDAVIRRVTADTVPWVEPGTWEVSALFYAAGGKLLEGVTLDTVTVALGEVGDASIVVRERIEPFDVRIENVTLTQAIQDFAGSVPLIPGREALVRVWLLASEVSEITPDIRLRVYDGTTVLLDSIASPDYFTQTRTSPFDPYLWSMFNVRVPGRFIRVGTRIRVDLDPNDAFPDSSAANDVWPRGGVPQTVAVREVPPLRMRFVPLRFGNQPSDVVMTTLGTDALLEETRRLHPLSEITYDFREELVTNVQRPTQYDATGWSGILSDLEAVRVLEGGGQTHYVGVMKVNYMSGIAGIGYISGHASLIWSDPPSGNGILAHELGHNFGRLHAPCGSPGGVDPDYPRTIAEIGDWGWDARRTGFSADVAPGTADLMSYCVPAWTSAYTWTGVMNQRAGAATMLAPEMGGRVLLVSGSISKGAVALGPVFLVEGASAVPGSGPHRLLISDASGAPILALRFASAVLSEPAAGVEQFTLAIPERLLGGRTPASLLVQAAGSRAELRSEGSALRAGAVAAARRPDGRIQLRWQGTGARGLIVRDATTGRIVSIVRGDAVVVPDLPAGYNITVSDGLQSISQRVSPAPR